MTDSVDNIRDELLGALIGVSRAYDPNVPIEDKVLDSFIECSFIYAAYDKKKELKNAVTRVHEIKHILVPDCSVCDHPCGRTSDYNVSLMFENSDEWTTLMKQNSIAAFSKMAKIAFYEKSVASIPRDLCEKMFKTLVLLGEDLDGSEYTENLLEVTFLLKAHNAK